MFLTRDEYHSAHQALVDKLEVEAKHTAEQLHNLGSRIDLNQGNIAGALQQKTQSRLTSGQILTAAAVVLTLIGVIVTILAIIL